MRIGRANKLPTTHIAMAVVFTCFLVGCGPGVRVVDVDTSSAAQLNTSVKVIEGTVPAGARLIGAVEATSCRNKAWDASPTNDNAILQLKSVTKERGGNAVGNVYCEPPLGTSIGTNCWSSIRCTGVAYSISG